MESLRFFSVLKIWNMIRRGVYNKIVGKYCESDLLEVLLIILCRLLFLLTCDQSRFVLFIKLILSNMNNNDCRSLFHHHIIDPLLETASVWNIKMN